MEPLSQDQIIKAFGDPFVSLRKDGTPNSGWEREILTTVSLPAPLPLSYNKEQLVHQISCHKLIAPLISKVFIDLHANEEVWNTINDYGGCYNWRAIAGSKKLSTHCWGISIDLDVTDNPYRDKIKIGDIHPLTVATFMRYGFFPGALFTDRSVDGMHWEFCDLGLL